MIQQFSAFLGVVRCEFRMQIHRLSLWITFFVIAIFGILVASGGPDQVTKDIMEGLTKNPLLTYVASFTSGIQSYAPIVVGCLMADRLIRDRKTKVDELLSTMKTSVGTRLAGKYIGALLATLVPLLLISLLQVGYIVYLSGNLLVIPMFILTCLVIMLPGMLFVAAFSLACPMIMPVPLYQFLFVGYWFWGNMFIKQHIIPTLSRTILTPSGVYMTQGIFHAEPDLGPATPFQGVASICLLVGIAFLVMFTLTCAQKWQQTHQ